MSENSSLHLVVALFGSQTGAEMARKTLSKSRDPKLIGICASIALQKDDKGRAYFRNSSTRAGKGAVEGAVLGSAAGLLTGGTSLALGAAGALVGGLVGKGKRAGCLEKQRLDQLAASLVPDSSAFVVVMKPGWGVVVERELKGMGADVLTADIPAGVDQGFDAGQEAAYAAFLKGVKDAGSRAKGS